MLRCVESHLDLSSLQPPAAPEQTHKALRASLPPFPRGDKGTRIARGKAYLAETRQQIEAHHRSGMSGLSVCRLIAEATDRLVIGLYEELASEMDAPSGLCLSALGGYGRRELAPHSDLDLLLLIGPEVPRGSEEKLRTFSGAFNTLLWDCKLVVGWSVRTAEECAKAAEDDHTVRTALLDCRYLCGSSRAYDHLTREVLRDLLTHKADAFIADKAKELRARREKYGDSLYLLEPNLKAGEGGLRDLEGALWIARARFRTKGLTGLLHEAVLPASEVAQLKAARDFLLRCRNHLHYLRGRKEDRLTFDLQEQVASFLGYQNGEQGLAVEQFMRHYYLSAKVIRRAADALIDRCEEGAATRLRLPFFSARRLGAFKVFRGRLTLDGGPELLTEDPANVVRLFRVSDEQKLPLYSWARDQVTHALPELARRRGDPEVVSELKALLVRPGSRGDFLTTMHELGVLGTLIPEFGRITAHHQHDMYHVYTVDIHSLFAVKRLYALREGDLDDEEPTIAREMRALDDPLPLYLGMMLHDAGKGMGGDHSRRGEELAVKLAERLQLSERQTEIIRFLVLQHLLMSRTSQRRDLSDPDLIAEFARQCGDEEKLTCLFLLTYADICSVGPQMWNDWKRRLLVELFYKARAWLQGERGVDVSGLLEQRRAAFEKRWSRHLSAAQVKALLRSLPDRYFLSTEPELAMKHARLLERARKQPFAATLNARREVGTSELTLAAKDRKGLLAILTGVLAAHRVDILGARIVSTENGLALDAFEVRGPQGIPLERSRFHAASADLERVLNGELTAEELIRKKRPNRLLARAMPKVPTRVSVDNQASSRFTIVDVRAEDRVGLLHAIAQALYDAGVEIALARIATEGNRALDAFYVTEKERKLSDEEADALALKLGAALERFAVEE